jgi:hypothetical protein
VSLDNADAVIEGATLFTVFVKGAGFSSMRNAQCAKKGRIGIGQWGKRMEDKKTRTLVQHKIQNRSKAGAPGFSCFRRKNVAASLIPPCGRPAQDLIRILHGFCEGCGFFFHVQRSVPEDRMDRNRPVGKANRV